MKYQTRGRPFLPSEELRGAKLARLTQKISAATLGRIFGVSRQAISKDIMKYREAVVREG
jgi:biotin operon repressor